LISFLPATRIHPNPKSLEVFMENTMSILLSLALIGLTLVLFASHIS
jgi:hypothetical protein